MLICRYFRLLIFLLPSLFSYHLAKAAWSGSDYLLHSKSQAMDAHHLLKIVKHESYENILDVGCGAGNITIDMAHMFKSAKIACVEPNASMFMQAKRELGHESRIEIFQADAQTFSLNQRFDLFTAFHVLHWVPKTEQLKALKNINQHLKLHATGLIILSPSKDKLPFGQALLALLRSIAYRNHFKDFKSPQTFYTVDEYRALLEEAGFFVESIGYNYTEKKYADPKALKTWIVQWLPHYQWLKNNDQNLAQTFMDDLMIQYREHSNQTSSDIIRWGEYIITAKVHKVADF